MGRIDSTPLRRFSQNRSNVLAWGNRPAMPIIAIALSMTRSDASTRRADYYTEVAMGGLERTPRAYRGNGLEQGSPSPGRRECAWERGPGSEGPLPPRRNKEPRHPILLRPLERLGRVEVEHGEAAEQDARGEAGAHHRHAFGRVRGEAELRLRVLRPRRPGVHEGCRLDGQEPGLEDAEPLGADQREPQLQVEHADPAPHQAVELRAGTGVVRVRRALRQADVPDLIATDQSRAADVERHQPLALRVGAVAADVHPADRERHRPEEEIAPVVERQRLELQVTEGRLDLEAVAPAAHGRREAEVAVV